MSLKPPGCRTLPAREVVNRSAAVGGAGARGGRHPRGLALIETLVAALVFGIGLAGIAGLLVLGLRAQRDAAQESGAVQLLAGVGEEIRALTGGDTVTLAALSGADPAASCRERPADCDREAAAALAAGRWRERVQQVLGPAAVADIERVEDSATGYRVFLRWRSGRVASRVAVARIEP